MATHDTDVQISICGSAGDGTIAAGDLLKQAMAHAGYRVIAFNTYPAEIRGFGKCIARTRISTEQVYSMKPRSDVLISLNDAHAIPHVGEVRDYGSVIYESAPITRLAEGQHISGHVRPGQLPYGLPLRELSERATGSNRSRNMVALGFLAGLYAMPREVFHAAIKAKFKTKPKAVSEATIAAFEAGLEVGAQTHRFDLVELGEPPESLPGNVQILSGNAAVAKGCIEGGLDNYFGYPITPATTIMERLAHDLPVHGKRMLQTEDEIAAISGAVGAGFAGARAATATSGPGLALMGEMLGLGVMAEVPCVIFVSQRGGPSTGLPTKTEQSDLNIAVHGGAGDAKRIVLAPTNVEGCWRCAGKAFEMAEAYQTPVIVLLDLYLSNRFESVNFDPDENFNLSIPRGKPKHRPGESFRRYQVTDSGVSPRSVPGEADGLHPATGLEHDEFGHPSYEADVHTAMSKKRHDKLNKALKHPAITISKRFGDTGKVDVGILAWGSTFGEGLEAMMLARKEGIRCAAMKVVMLSPLPEAEISAFMDDCDEVLVPELNFEGQFANLVSGTLGRPLHRLNEVTGHPMSVSAILDQVRALAAHNARNAA